MQNYTMQILFVFDIIYAILIPKFFLYPRKESSLSLPMKSILQDSEYSFEGKVDNVSDLQILHNAHVSIYGTSSINSDTKKLFKLRSMGIHNSGKLSQISRSLESLNFDIESDMHVYAGAVVNVSSLTVNATDISVDVAGLVTASGRGYTNGLGPGHGYNSLLGNASGAGHGGSGGAGKDSNFAGRAYGSFLEPLEFGSGGGYGYKRQVCVYEFHVFCEFVILSLIEVLPSVLFVNFKNFIHSYYSSVLTLELPCMFCQPK